jgi:small conductance mechanosensitive channel
MSMISLAVFSFIKSHVAEISWILGLYLAGRLGLRVITAKIVSAADDGDDSRDSGREKRAKTLSGLIGAGGKVVIFGVILMMALRLFGVDPTPIIAGAGVIGFAVGFGMQTLVKDFIAGIFIFSENQFAVGDKVKIGAFEGTVHKMSIRSTVLRDADGHLVFMPNGSIANVVNYSLAAVGTGKDGAHGGKDVSA